MPLAIYCKSVYCCCAWISQQQQQFKSPHLILQKGLHNRSLSRAHDDTIVCSSALVFVFIGPPPDARTNTTGVCSGETPRHVHIPSQESQYKPTQTPTEEVCHTMQALTGSLNMADLTHGGQQGTPIVDHRGILFHNRRKSTIPAVTKQRAKPG